MSNAVSPKVLHAALLLWTVTRQSTPCEVVVLRWATWQVATETNAAALVLR